MLSSLNRHIEMILFSMVTNPYPPEHYKALADLVRRLSDEGTKTIIFGDTFHPGENMLAPGNPEVMKAVSESEFKDFYLEAPVENLWLTYRHNDTPIESFRSVIASTVYQSNNPEGKKALVEAGMNLLQEAKANGMDMHFPDPRYEEIKATTKADPLLQFGGAIFWQLQGLQTDPACIEEQLKAGLENLSPIERDAAEKFFNATDNVVSGNKANIRISDTAHQISNKEKRVYFYGVQHTEGLDDLDERNPDSKVIAVAARPGSAMYTKGSDIKDMPDYAFYVESGRVVKLDTPESQREFLFGAPDKLKFWLTPEQKQACLDALPFETAALVTHDKVRFDSGEHPPSNLPPVKVPGPIQGWEVPKKPGR